VTERLVWANGALGARGANRSRVRGSVGAGAEGRRAGGSEGAEGPEGRSGGGGGRDLGGRSAKVGTRLMKISNCVISRVAIKGSQIQTVYRQHIASDPCTD
jgi:hypothetical protein